MQRPFSALQELGDTTRLSVFLAILGIRKNVSQIVAELGLAQPQVSYHLRKLKNAGLAVEEKDGRWVWYQANWDTADRNLRDFIELMARWAKDTGAAEAGHPADIVKKPAGERALVGATTVERPKKRDSDLDDFLL
jgi:ArsR family transcriptional regulator